MHVAESSQIVFQLRDTRTALLEHYWNHGSEISPISVLLKICCCLFVYVYR